MPQLPSGRHVAISADPLAELLENSQAPQNIHRLMGISTETELLRHFKVLYLLPRAAAPAEATSPVLRNESLPAPVDHLIVDAGFSLAEWQAKAHDWSDEDRRAFQEFLDGRARPLIDNAREQVASRKMALRLAEGLPSQILAAWHRAGVHPSQEPGWHEADVGGPEWDDYDVLAALGQVVRLLPSLPQFAEPWQIRARLEAMWGAFAQDFPEFAHWPDPTLPVRECAAQARDEGWLLRLDEGRRAWLHTQAIIEVAQLWNGIGDRFQAAMPQPYGIVELVVISGAADEHL